MPAGPYPTKAMFQRLETLTVQTLLSAGSGALFSPQLGGLRIPRMVSSVHFRNGPADLIVSEVGLNVALSPEVVHGLRVVDAGGADIAAVYAGAGSGVTYVTPPVTQPSPYTVMRLPETLVLPGDAELIVMFTQPQPLEVHTQAGLSTDGTSVQLMDENGEPTNGLLYVTVAPPAGARVTGRLHQSGMRRVPVPTDAFEFVRGDFEIVDDGVEAPYLRLLSRSGVEYRWAGTPEGGGLEPPSGGGS